MTNRILTENGHFIATLGDKGNSDISLPGHPQPNRPHPTARHSYHPRRVDMTGHLYANDESDSSSDEEDCLELRQKILLDRPRPGRNVDIAQKEERALNEIELRFKKIVSGFNDHQRLLSKYRERKEKLETNVSSDKKTQPRDHNAIATTLSASSLRGERTLQEHRLETKDPNPMNVNKQIRSQQHASTPLPKPTTTSTGSGVNDRPTADYFRRKIQAFDKLIKGYAPGSPAKRKKSTNSDASPSPKKVQDQSKSNQHANQNKINSSHLANNSPLQRNHRGNTEQATRMASSRVNLAGELFTKSPDRTGDGTLRGFLPTKHDRPTKLQIEKEETKASPNNHEHNGATTTTKSQILTSHILHYNTSSGLNETMSTWSSGRDVEMGEPLPPETNSERKCAPNTIKTMICQGESPHRLLTTKGILLITIVLYGIGMLYGYLSSMKSAM